MVIWSVQILWHFVNNLGKYVRTGARKMATALEESATACPATTAQTAPKQAAHQASTTTRQPQLA